jgi:hypothetical protein
MSRKGWMILHILGAFLFVSGLFVVGGTVERDLCVGFFTTIYHKFSYAISVFTGITYYFLAGSGTQFKLPNCAQRSTPLQ